MKNVYYAQTAWENRTLEQAVGQNCRPVCRPETRFCATAENKVIDLAAWKAENLAKEELGGALGQYQERELVRRPRQKHVDALIRGELAATLSVVGLTAALLLRVLVF